jgi:hypothetical protein
VILRFDSALCIDFASADDFADVLDEEDPTQGRFSLFLSLSLSLFPIPLYHMLTLDGVHSFFSIGNACVHVNSRGGGRAIEEEEDDDDKEDEESGLQDKKVAPDAWFC